MLKKLSLAATAALACICAHGALAHVTFERAEATPGASYKGVLRVPHGCKGEATHTVRVQLPDALVVVKPMAKAGWTVSTRIGPYAAPFDDHGRVITEGVREIVWSGGNLPDAHYDEFAFVGRIAPGARAGETIYAPLVQECASGTEQWVETPAPGQSASGLKSPAPSIRLVAEAAPAIESGHAGHAGHMASAAAQTAPVQTASAQTYRLGALTISAPWTRATPKGAPVAGGYLTISNGGTEADRLIGGSFELSGAVEVHQMSMEGDVMRMRQMREGLEIKPGASVQLKPSGYHLMFTGLKQQVVAGQRVKGSLVFEKAGTVEVEFEAAGMGASSPASAGMGASSPASAGIGAAAPSSAPSGHQHH